jgi:hypothetical protein
MCTNFCKNNVPIDAFKFINTITEKTKVQNNILSTINRPSRNFKFIFHYDETYFTILCATSEDKKILHQHSHFSILAQGDYQLCTRREYAIHVTNCDEYNIQYKEKLLFNNK